MAGERLHGTDGIRGRIGSCGKAESPIEKLIFQREVSPELFAVIGEATGIVLRRQEVAKPRPEDFTPLVVIGWDRRDGNEALVNSLELGLLKAGCNTQRVGEVPTPGLHHSLLLLDADAGMMVTASHNPATDSGVKLLDRDGCKSMPDLEDLISHEAWALDSTPSMDGVGGGNTLPLFDGLGAYRKHLGEWLEIICSRLEVSTQQWSGVMPPDGMLLDSSGGSATDWFCSELSQRGIDCYEVSSRLKPINEGCGAGSFDPTDKWSNTELMETELDHILLKALAEKMQNNDGIPPWSEGDVVGAALDGDGDRCLLLEATVDGICVVDGDQMAYDWLQAGRLVGMEEQLLAHSIESDLCLSSACADIGVSTTQTAVGDRWLSNALMPSTDDSGRLLVGDSMPNVCGSEDSGHLVMPSPHPLKPTHWGLTGDGAATLLSQLSARVALGSNRKILERGWKRRVAVKGVDRFRWDGRNELADKIVKLVEEALPTAILHRGTVAGESSLLLLEGSVDGERLSIGIRNSGTEAKTSVTVKSENRPHEELAAQLADFLRVHLVRR
jgi:phosphoglucosamine mutase